MEGGGLRAEGGFLVLYGLCRERLENRVLETALVSCCSAPENHEGGEYDIMILAAVQADCCPRRSNNMPHCMDNIGATHDGAGTAHAQFQHYL